MTDELVKKAMEEWASGRVPLAEKLLLEAARAGSGHAAHNLGTLYATGGPGVDADPVKSRRFYVQALDSGFEESIATDPEWFRK